MNIHRNSKVNYLENKLLYYSTRRLQQGRYMHWNLPTSTQK